MDDMHRVFDTGYFSLCKPVAEETRDGIKLTLEARRLCRLAAAWLLFGCRLAAAACGPCLPACLPASCSRSGALGWCFPFLPAGAGTE